MRPRDVVFVGAILGVVAGYACNSDPDPSPILVCDLFDYSEFDGMTPNVTFGEVLQIFRSEGCAKCGCHSEFQPPTKGMYLGPPPGKDGGFAPCVACEGEEDGCTPDPEAPDPKSIIENFLEQPSETAPGMHRIVPGEPEKSFLLHKLDGTAIPDCLARIEGLESVTCTGKDPEPCGSLMPKGQQTPILAEDRDVIRRWVMQGATVD